MLFFIIKTFDFEFVEAIGDVFAELFEEVLHGNECISISSLLFLLSFIGSSYSHIHRKSICKVRQFLMLFFHIQWMNLIRYIQLKLLLTFCVYLYRIYDAESRQEILYSILKDSLKTEDVAKMENEATKNSHEVYQALRNSRGLHDSYLYRFVILL